MSNENVDLGRTAYEAYSRGDVAALLQFVDHDLEWTNLDPSLEDPEPQVCHGRHELEAALERQAERGLKAEVEEVVASGDRVMVVVRTPGVDAFRAYKADDRSYAVFTARKGEDCGSARLPGQRGGDRGRLSRIEDNSPVRPFRRTSRRGPDGCTGWG